METALTAFSSGQVRQPVREVIEAGGSGNFFAAMPAWLETGPAMGAKLVTVYHANGQPRIAHASGRNRTARRADRLSAGGDGRPLRHRGAHRGGIRRGSTPPGAAGRARRWRLSAAACRQAAICAPSRWCGNSTEIRCWSPTPANLRTNSSQRTRIVRTGSKRRGRGARRRRGAAGDRLSDSGRLERLGIGPAPAWYRVGACRPYQREMDPLLVARGRVIVDSRAAALKEAGDLVMAIAEGHFLATASPAK